MNVGGDPAADNLVIDGNLAKDTRKSTLRLMPILANIGDNSQPFSRAEEHLTAQTRVNE